MGIESLGRILASYFDFMVAFSTHPHRTLEPCAGKAQVDPRLAEHFLVGMAIALGLGLVAGPQRPETAGTIVHTYLTFLRQIDPAVFPLFAAIAVFGVAAAGHGIVRALEAAMRFIAEADLTETVPPPRGGPAHSTINAALAFTGWYLPQVSLVFLATDLPPEVEEQLLWVFLPLALGVVAAPYVYVPLSLSGAHPGVSAFGIVLLFGGLSVFWVMVQVVISTPWVAAPFLLMLPFVLRAGWRGRQARRHPAADPARTDPVVSEADPLSDW